MKRLKNHLLYHLAVAVIALVRRLPLRLARALGAAVGRLALNVARPERRRALDNISRAYPALTPRDRRRLARRAFAHLGRSAFECLAADRATLERLVDTAAAEVVLRRRLAGGHGLVFVSAHFGNWELMAAAVAALKLAPVYVLARKSYDRRFTRVIECFRLERGVRCIWVESPGHLRQALRVLRAGAIVGVLLDQPMRQGGFNTEFFGHIAPTSPVAAWLARLSGAPVVAGFIHRRGEEHALRLRGVDEPAATDHDRRLTQRLTAEIETAIAGAPEHWAWSLNRWRSGTFEGLSRERGARGV